MLRVNKQKLKNRILFKTEVYYLIIYSQQEFRTSLWLSQLTLNTFLTSLEYFHYWFRRRVRLLTQSSLAGTKVVIVHNTTSNKILPVTICFSSYCFFVVFAHLWLFKSRDYIRKSIQNLQDIFLIANAIRNSYI